MSDQLRELREDPFRLLFELDRQIRAAREYAAEGRSGVWEGVAFRLGDTWVVAPKDDVKEVVPPPKSTRVPNSRSWFAGIANVRGNPLSVIDFSEFVGRAKSVPDASTRVLVLNSERIPVGFLVDAVAGYRQFTVNEQRPPELKDDDLLTPFVLGGFQRKGRAWTVISLHKLAQSDALARAGR